MKDVAFRFMKALGLNPLQTGAKSGLRGHVDAVTRHGAQGWALDTGRPGYRPEVEALLDGRVIASTRADRHRPDLAPQGLGDGSNGFQLDFPAGFSGDDVPRVTIRLAESQAVLYPRRGGGKVAGKAMEGLFETLSDDLVASGWAMNPGRPGHRCRITVALDDEPVASGLADMFRADLLAAGKGDGGHAFRIAIPPGGITRPGHLVDVLADGIRLQRSPKPFDLARVARPRLAPPRDGGLRLSFPHWNGAVEGVGIRINDGPAIPLAWTGPVEDWPLPPDCLDGRPRVYQATAVVAGLAVVGEPMVFTAPSYVVALRRADFDGLCVRVARTDASCAPRIGVWLGDDCLGVGQPQGRGADAACLVDLAFQPPLQGERVRLWLRDADTALPVAVVDVVRRHQGLLDLARLAMATGDEAEATLVNALVADKALFAPESNFAALSLPFPPAPPERDQPVAVVIPIYSGLRETRECLESVLAARNETRSQVLLIDDCAPEPALREYLDELEARTPPDWRVVRLPVNRGFPAAANIGMAMAGGRDVVLLNADTVVFDGWIDRLRAAATRVPRVGTVTPFTNNGEICTVPTICACLPVEDMEVGRAVDAVCAAQNAGRIADLPVGVGFCLYLRRGCLDDVGLFDEAAWGKGYGEETDLCLRAAARGWRNVLAGDCFVVHRGQVSFGPQKLDRIRESSRKILQRHPYYDDHIQRFIKADPARSLRQAVSLGLLGQGLPKRRTLHVMHSYLGGSERYLRELAAREEAGSGIAPLLLRCDEAGESTLSVPVFDQRLIGLFRVPHEERYSRQAGADLRQALELLDIEAMHLHAPFGLSVSLLRWLTTSWPYDLTVHDYAWLCPRVTLSDDRDRYCGEPDPDGCRACLARHGAHPGLAGILAATGDIEAYRDLFREVLAGARTVWVGAGDVAERVRRHGFSGAFTVRPHPDSFPPRTLPPPVKDGRVRVALFGALSGIKGLSVLAACARAARAADLPLLFTLFGYPSDDLMLAGLDNVSVTGPYHEEDLDDLVAARRPDLAFFPFQVPETYSYTLSHAFRMGLWPVVADIGAPAERVRQCGRGVLYPPDTPPEALCTLLLSEAGRLPA